MKWPYLFLITTWLPPVLVDSVGWLWRRGWFRRLLMAGCVASLLAALAWGSAMWWSARELLAIQREVTQAGLPTSMHHIPMPALAACDNGEPYVRAAQALLGRWSKGYYTVNQPEAAARLHPTMSNHEWRCTSAEDRTETLAFLDQPQRLLAWDLLARAARHAGVAFPALPFDEASLMLPQRSVLALARLRIRLLVDAGRQDEAEAQLTDLVRLIVITTPPPDAVSFLAWHDTVNGTLHLLKRLLADGRLGERAAATLIDTWAQVPNARDLLLRLADAERLRLDRSLLERTPLLEPLPPEGLVDLAAQAFIGGAGGEWLVEPLRRHVAAQLMGGNLAVRQVLQAMRLDDGGLPQITLPADADPATADIWRFCLALEGRTRRALVLTRIALAVHRQHLSSGAWPTTLDGLTVPVPAWVRWQPTENGGTLGLDDSADKALREALVWNVGR